MALTACHKDEIEVRRVPKEDAAPGLAGVVRPRGLSWTTPRGWVELPGDGMRAATLRPPAALGRAEATIVALPGDVGGELANVNRWRGQIGLPPIDEAALALLRKHVLAPVGPIDVYDFTGNGGEKSHLVAGMIQVRGTTWFFKLSGEARAVRAAKPAFLKMLRGLKI